MARIKWKEDSFCALYWGRLDTARFMKDIQHVKKHLEEGVEPSLLTKAEARIADA